MRGFALSDKGGVAEPRAPEETLAFLIREFQGTDPPAGLDALKATYLRALYGLQALVILDNVKNEAQVQDLIPPEPVALLITSRNLIQLSGGKVVHLGQMSKPEALKLISQVMSDHRKIKNADAMNLAKILGFLPIALRWAANLLVSRPTWTVSDYLEKLEAGRSPKSRSENCSGHKFKFE